MEHVVVFMNCGWRWAYSSAVPTGALLAVGLSAVARAVPPAAAGGTTHRQLLLQHRVLCLGSQ
ncbi:hypothetical protein SK128_006719, partial [Halocaridina rubra]